MRIYLSIQFFVKQGFFVGRAFCVGIFIEWGFNGGGRRITEVAGILANTSVNRVRIQ